MLALNNTKPDKNTDEKQDVAIVISCDRKIMLTDCKLTLFIAQPHIVLKIRGHILDDLDVPDVVKAPPISRFQQGKINNRSINSASERTSNNFFDRTDADIIKYMY